MEFVLTEDNTISPNTFPKFSKTIQHGLWGGASRQKAGRGEFPTNGASWDVFPTNRWVVGAPPPAKTQGLFVCLTIFSTIVISKN